MSVLVTDAHLRYSRVVLQSLGRKGVVTDASGEKDNPNVAFYSRYCRNRYVYPSPEQHEEAFVRTLLKRAADYDVLMPMHERTVVPISKHLKSFTSIVRVPIPEYQVLKLALDKAETVRVAENAGIPTPRTYFISDLNELDSLSRRLDYPVVVKLRAEMLTPPPRYVYAYSAEDLIRKYKNMHEIHPYPLIQEQIPGEGYGFFAILTEDHEAAAIFCHRRIREFPITGGPSTYCESVYNRKLIANGLKLLKEMKWYGIAMVEFRLDHRDDEFKLMELNPRFWGSLPLAIAAGVNFPYLLYRMALGEEVRPQLTYATGVKCRFLLFDLLALKQALNQSRDKTAYAKKFMSSFLDRRASIGDFALNDFGPTGYQIAHGMRRRSAGLVEVLANNVMRSPHLQKENIQM